MTRFLTMAGNQAADRYAIQTQGIPGETLMAAAGEQVVAQCRTAGFLERPDQNILILAGKGNNGGDGFVVARQLHDEGVAVRVLVIGQREKIGGDALNNLNILEKMGLEVGYLEKGSKDTVLGFLADADLVIDGILGTGFSGTLREPVGSTIEAVNEFSDDGIEVVALDIPSGLNCDTGQAADIAVRADCTITFAAMKKGFLVEDAMEYTGDVLVASIGIDVKLLLP